MLIIMHIDMNSYFATVEQQSNPFLRGKPVCVAGKGNGERTVCSAASIEAKKFGVKSGTSVWEAKRLCPEIKIVCADYDKYLFVSRAFIKIFESYTPYIEVFSIDEAFLDLSSICKNNNEAVIIAKEIKKRIKKEIGDYLKCSVGISYNRLLAKVASELQKPDGLTIIDKNNLDEILNKTPVDDLCGVGRRIGSKLKTLKIHTVKELGEYPNHLLNKIFGPFWGPLLHNMGQGIDHTPIMPYFEMPAEKSFGHSYTLPRDIYTKEDTLKVLLKLCEKVGRRMRKGKAMGKTFHLYVRFGDFTGEGARLTLPNYTNDGKKIYEMTQKMLQKITFGKSIRMVGVSVSNILPQKNISMPILPEDLKREKVVKTLDIINDKYGEFTIFPSCLSQIKDKIQNIPDGRNKRIYG